MALGKYGSSLQLCEPPAFSGFSGFSGPLRLAQYFRILSETSWRSEGLIDLRPRRLAGAGSTGMDPAVRWSSSSEAMTRSSFSFSA